jgi:hypothetical protein
MTFVDPMYVRLFDFCDTNAPHSDELYDEVDMNTESSTTNLATLPLDNVPAQPYASAAVASNSPPVTVAPYASTAVASTSPPMTTTSSISPTAALVTITPGIQDNILNVAHNNTMPIAGIAPSLPLTLSEPSLPLAGVHNSELVGQCESSGRRTKGLAVVGTGLTEKCVMLQQVLVS